VPAGSAAALICDTGALIDYLVESAPDHRRFRDAIDQARTRYVPGLVLAEVDYFLREERGAMQAFMQDLARGAFTYAPPTIGQLSRAMDWTDASEPSALASSIVRSWRSPSRSAFVAWPRATCVTSRPSDCMTAARLSWSFARSTPYLPLSALQPRG
jgi:predicted nucleic acid-binding protein